MNFIENAFFVYSQVIAVIDPRSELNERSIVFSFQIRFQNTQHSLMLLLMIKAIDVFCLMGIGLASTIKEVTTSVGDAQDQDSELNEESAPHAKLASAPE